MQIIEFDARHVEQAQALAQDNYQEERRRVPALPDCAPPSLAEFAQNGLGRACVENGRLLGFLCGLDPWENALTTTARGTFCPMHAHGAVSEGRERIYQRLYQAAAEAWVRAGIASHGVAVYAHDRAAIRAFYQFGFGRRCGDAMRPLEEIEAPAPAGYEYAELPPDRHGEAVGLRLAQLEHMGQSPCFMKTPESGLAGKLQRLEALGNRVFVALWAREPVALLEVGGSGETFASASPGTANLCGAYCLPAHRGKGVAAQLLNQVIRALRAEGYDRLGVDYESINPTAAGFWGKHFAEYTHGVVRRIDESAFR